MFKKYEKMVESTNTWNSKGVKCFKSKAASDHWVVTEKIHGANFSFVASPTEVQCAKRDSIIEDSDDFFGYLTVREKYHQNVQAAFQALSAAHGDVLSAVFFGELYGGRYPHPDVTPTDATPVQQGVWYSPHIDWICYDIRVTTAETSRYLPFTDVMSVCSASMVPCVKPLLVAPFNDCVNFKIPFGSTIAKQHHSLPMLPSNTAEGVVVKGYSVDYLVPLASSSKKVRAIVKIKADEFAEWGDKKTVCAVASAGDGAALVKGCVNSNRLNCVLSKHGKLTKKSKPLIAEKMSADIADDIASTAGAEAAIQLKPEIQSQVAAFIKNL
eukprot:TRINITY_DN14436_c1_g1_i1.p1 TRINITY_DN14436_c1_g1~~TRINITY_DN14436_c1_g1_i1.p1  ORF type:complete len:347 (+),score=81.60 TRINITY_DN14436_c1_g1_i1:61-1041(+)